MMSAVHIAWMLGGLLALLIILHMRAVYSLGASRAVVSTHSDLINYLQKKLSEKENEVRALQKGSTEEAVKSTIQSMLKAGSS